MNTRPEPAIVMIARLRVGLALIGLAMGLECLRVEIVAVRALGGLTFLGGLVLVGASFRRLDDGGRRPTEDPSPPPAPEPVDPSARIDGLRKRLEAARQVGDLGQVLDYHEELASLLDADGRQELNRETLRWVMTLIQRRLRAGAAKADVAELTARAAERFGDTIEGASLRASLPTLRRAAGLCPRCGRAYGGAADTCPDCLSKS